jgi:hypothetical protein
MPVMSYSHTSSCLVKLPELNLGIVLADQLKMFLHKLLAGGLTASVRHWEHMIIFRK